MYLQHAVVRGSRRHNSRPSVMFFDVWFFYNLPINARQMHVMLLCAELADLRGSGSAQAMR